MAKYYGVHTCGHDGVVDVIGRVKDRQWQIDKYFNEDCPDCKSVKREKEIEEVNRRTKQRADEMNLPQLKGTEKQIAWAITLRDEFIVKGQELIDKAYEIYKNTGEYEVKDEEGNVLFTVDSLRDSFLHLANNEKTSVYWIDNRKVHPANLITKNVKNIPSTTQ